MPLNARAARSAIGQSTTPEAGDITVGAPAASLLERLSSALDAHGVSYCQWKGHWAAHRWASGRGDVDLLVDHEARIEFRMLMGELGFKPALPPGARQIPGIESYFGHDPAVPRLLHIHVHYRLVLGDFWRTTYRIPLERPMLETAIAGSAFRIPEPAYQLLVFVMRIILLQRGRPLLAVGTRWRRGIRIQLDNLEGLTDRGTLATILARHLPSIDLPFFDRCVATLRGQGGVFERALLPSRLHYRLRAHARRPPLAALLGAALEKILPKRLRRMFSDERMRLAGGGTVVALVGGDGAGKSTCARELAEWLADDFMTMRAHLGNPPRALLTFAVGGALKVEQALNRLLRRDQTAAGYMELARYVCAARDSYRLYIKVRRFAAHGGSAICERYPVPRIHCHVGPSIPALLPANPSLLARLLRFVEAWYYDQMLPPDALFVLRVDPELAVLRKTDEPAHYVRARGRIVWETDWTRTGARVVDVNRPLSEVLKDLKSLIWSAL